MNEKFNHLKTGEKRHHQLLQALIESSQSFKSIHRIIFLTEIEHILSGSLASKPTPVDETEYKLFLSEGDRKAIVEEVKRLAPERNRNKDSFNNTAAIVQQLLFNHLKSFSTDRGATDLLNQFLLRENKHSVESAHIKARISRLRKELSLFYEYSIRLLSQEKIPREISSTEVISLFEAQHTAFIQRANFFSEHINAFHPNYSLDLEKKNLASLEQLTKIISLREQFKPTLLKFFIYILQCKIPSSSLTLFSLTKNQTARKLHFSLLDAEELLAALQTQEYINDLGTPQSSYFEAIDKEINLLQPLTAQKTNWPELMNMIQKIVTTKKAECNFKNIIKLFSQFRPRASSAKCLYLLASILLTEKHLLSLFPDSYSESQRSSISSDKTAHFFMFLYLYFSRSFSKPNILADILLIDCFSKVLSCEDFSNPLHEGLQELKNSLSEKHLKKVYSPVLRDRSTIITIGKRLNLYLNSTVKVANVSQIFSQEQFAKSLGCTQQELSNLIRGQNNSVPLSLLLKISKETGLGILYLLGKSDDPTALPNDLSRAVFKIPKGKKVLYLSDHYKNKLMSKKDRAFLKSIKKKIKVKFISDQSPSSTATQKRKGPPND